jgi:hypothetical protein
VGFETTILAIERVKTVHALDRAATVIGLFTFSSLKLFSKSSSYPNLCSTNTSGTLYVVAYFRRSFDAISLQMPGFNPWAIDVEFVLYIMVLLHASLAPPEYFYFLLPIIIPPNFPFSHLSSEIGTTRPLAT